MSSHREAPEIAKDPVADSTDVYAFVSPDKPGTVTLIANYVPLQEPAAGPNLSLDSPNWNRRQFCTVSKVNAQGVITPLGAGLACPPCNIGPLSTPDYPALAGAAVHRLGGGGKVFAGQRAEGFYVDLGSIFDLANLRPFQQL